MFLFYFSLFCTSQCQTQKASQGPKYMVPIALCAPWPSSFPLSRLQPLSLPDTTVTTGTHQPSQKPHLLVEKHGQHELVGLLRQVGEEQDVIGWILRELLGEMAVSEQGYPRRMPGTALCSPPCSESSSHVPQCTHSRPSPHSQCPQRLQARQQRPSSYCHYCVLELRQHMVHRWCPSTHTTPGCRPGLT